jgi:hypothetical protein
MNRRIASICRLIALCFFASPQGAQAQGSQISCEQYARDYSNMVAPRSGAPAFNGGATGRRPQTGQSRESMEWAQMAPNQSAYRAAQERCLAGRR